MHALRSIRIGYRLFTGFTVILGLCILIAGLGVWRLSVIDFETKNLMATPLLKERLISDLSANVAAGVRRTLAIVKSNDPTLATFFSADAAELTKSGSEIQKKVEALLTGPEEKKVFERLVKARSEYISMRDAIMKEKASGNLEATNKLFEEKFNPSVSGYQNALKEMLQFQRDTMDKIGSDIGEISAQSRNLMLLFSVLAVAFGAGWAWLLTRSITVPLKSALAVVKTVAEGDLTAKTRAVEKDELGQLLNSLTEMNDSLAGMISTVRTGTDAIANGAGEIAAGNQDLSSRTEQQASALEETASSMEELTSTVRQNADNARQADQLATAASGIAAKGGTAVGEVVNTMSSINESSRKIADIIAVIDGIAFQTNILALNAAVEAARAGEQGRGFAVVASEVRSLAQRSAAAAKEIKELIDDSVAKVGLGVSQVDQAGSTMKDIMQSVQRVTDIMGEILAATAEQTSGIEQINQAINQMDQTTQQNAALVEEAAAASTAMQDQADKLAEAVSVFKLDSMRPAFSVSSKPAARVVSATKRTSVTNVPRSNTSASLAISARTIRRTAARSDDWEQF
ncbi:HAMP domain-containing protein [Oxalobacteraceae bacterium OM1]|nr:HAMP domain-containing protein [Oxalobacteraceae bacterium OM1]